MFDGEAYSKSESEVTGNRPGWTQGTDRELDAESLLSAELADTVVLTREEEKSLARRIVRARKRVRGILRQGRKVTRAALTKSSRGVILPEQDFREREAVTILHYANRMLTDRRLARKAGLRQRELRAFTKSLSSALADYRVLRDQMVCANVRLVTMLARRYRHPGVGFLDLFQEGTLGLMRAVEKYEPERNVKFSTYAGWWIWQRLGRSADVQGTLIRTPVHWHQFRRRQRREAEKRAGTDGGALSRQELATIEGMEPARFEAMAQTFRFLSTDAPVNEEDERPLEATLPGNAIEPEETALHSDLRRHLESAIDQLPLREGSILRRRFGLGDDQTQTLEQLGGRFGVSRERIRQLENRALRQLKEVCEQQGLQDYLH